MDGSRRVRLKQLSFELGLSQTTISRALAGYPDVSKATRRRVLEAARSSGYLTARATLRRGWVPSGFVGMLLPMQDSDIIDPNIGLFVAGLSERLAREGRTLLLAAVPPGHDGLATLTHLIDSQQADAVVVHGLTRDDPCIALLAERDHPFVALGRLLEPHAPFSWFDLDAEAAFRAATQLLVGLGHRAFATFGPSEPYCDALIRQRGVETALREAGLGPACHRTVRAPAGESDAISAAAGALLARAPTAVLALQDTYGLAVIEAARRRGIAVPGQLSVIGFGDIPGAGASGLSTFAQQARRCGEIVAGMVVQRLDSGGTAAMSRLMPVDFVARTSHGPAPLRSAGPPLRQTARPAQLMAVP